MAKGFNYPVINQPNPASKITIHDADDSYNTKAITLESIHSSYEANSGTLYIQYDDVDDAGSLYDYHGGLDAYDAWVVVRYLKTDLSQKTIARVAANPTMSNLGEAWTNRATLTYV